MKNYFVMLRAGGFGGLRAKFALWFQSSLGLFALLFVITYLAHFLYSLKFGFYEDDFHHVARTYCADFRYLLCYIGDVMHTARPLSFVFPGVAGFLGKMSGDLFFIYLLGVAIVATNGWLVYRIALRFLSPPLAFTAGLFFILSPADVTKQMLTHIYALQLSLLFSLLGIYLYCERGSKRAYILPFFSLLTYESPFLLFLFAPFFQKTDRINYKRVVQHWALCLGFIIVVFLVRWYWGEDRVSGIVSGGFFSEFIPKTVLGSLIGIFTSLSSYFRALFMSWHSFKVLSVFFSVSTFIGIYLWMKKQRVDDGGLKTITFLSITKRKTTEIHRDRYLLILSSLLLPVSYGFAFTHFPPQTLVGRFTSEHLVATVTWGFFIASLFSVILRGNNKKNKLIALIVVYLLIFTNFNYALGTQSSYSKLWKMQKNLFVTLERLCPDLLESDGVIISPDIKKDFRTAFYGEIDVQDEYHWALYTSSKLYYGQKDGTPYVVLYRPLGDRMEIRKNNGRFEFWNNGEPHWGAWVPITDRTILIQKQFGRLVRVQKLDYSYVNPSSQQAETFSVQFKPISPDNSTPLPRGPIYDLF